MQLTMSNNVLFHKISNKFDKDASPQQESNSGPLFLEASTLTTTLIGSLLCSSEIFCC